MRISDVSMEQIRDFCGVSDSDSDFTLQILSESALAYIRSYTGLNEIQVDEKEDLTPAYLVLINDLYQNRETTRAAGQKNDLIDKMLDLHRVKIV